MITYMDLQLVKSDVTFTRITSTVMYYDVESVKIIVCHTAFRTEDHSLGQRKRILLTILQA